MFNILTVSLSLLRLQTKYDNTPLEDPPSSDENEDLEKHHILPSDKKDVYHFMGEQMG
jgi:hypothetical protein